MLKNQIEEFKSGIINKTLMDEAVDNGMKYGLWVKYPTSLFYFFSKINMQQVLEQMNTGTHFNFYGPDYDFFLNSDSLFSAWFINGSIESASEG